MVIISLHNAIHCIPFAVSVIIDSDATLIGRSSHCSVLLPDSSVLIMGGRTSGTSYSNEVWKTVDGGSTWSLVTSSAWSKGEEYSLLPLRLYAGWY